MADGINCNSYGVHCWYAALRLEGAHIETGHWNSQTLSCFMVTHILKRERKYLCKRNSTKKMFLMLTTVFKSNCFSILIFGYALRFDQRAIIHFRSILVEFLESLTNLCVYLGSLGYLCLYFYLSISVGKKEISFVFHVWKINYVWDRFYNLIQNRNVDTKYTVFKNFAKHFKNLLH